MLLLQYFERHQADLIEVYENIKMVAKMAAKMGCFLKMTSFYVVYVLY